MSKITYICIVLYSFQIITILHLRKYSYLTLLPPESLYVRRQMDTEPIFSPHWLHVSLDCDRNVYIWGKHVYTYFPDILPVFRKKMCSDFSCWTLGLFLGRNINFLKTFSLRFLFKWFTVKFKFLYLGRIMFIYQPPVSRKFSGKADT